MTAVPCSISVMWIILSTPQLQTAREIFSKTKMEWVQLEVQVQVPAASYFLRIGDTLENLLEINRKSLAGEDPHGGK